MITSIFLFTIAVVIGYEQKLDVFNTTNIETNEKQVSRAIFYTLFLNETIRTKPSILYVLL